MYNTRIRAGVVAGLAVVGLLAAASSSAADEATVKTLTYQRSLSDTGEVQAGLEVEPVQWRRGFGRRVVVGPGWGWGRRGVAWGGGWGPAWGGGWGGPGWGGGWGGPGWGWGPGLGWRTAAWGPGWGAGPAWGPGWGGWGPGWGGRRAFISIGVGRPGFWW